MKITKVSTEKYKWPKAKPIQNGKTTFTHNSLNLVCIETDEGITGYGTSYELNFVDRLGALLIGEDPLNNEKLWKRMYVPKFLGRKGNSLWSISAIDIALWDIRGKYYNTPVYQLLGGKRRPKLRAYASQLQFGWNNWENGKDTVPGYVKPQRTPEDYARESKKAVDDGYDAIKIDFFTFKPDVGNYGDLDRLGLIKPSYLKMLEERISAVREAIGPDVDLIIENHSYTDAQSSVQLGNMAKKYGVFYFEEPTSPTPRLSRFVHENTGLPVANGERIYTRWQYIEYFNQDAIQVIQPDIGTCGGITEVKKICDMAYVVDVGVQVHACGSPISTAAALQVECVIPNFVIHEHHTYACSQHNRELCKYDLQPVNGSFEVPEEATRVV